MATEKQVINTYDGKVIHFLPNSHQYRLLDNSEKGYTNLLSPSGIVGKLDKSRPLMIWNDGLIRNHIQEVVVEGESYDKTAITQIVDKALKVREEKLEEAQDVGSQIHDFAEHYAYLQVMGDALPTHDEIELYETNELVKAGKKAFLDFVKEWEIEFVDVERFVYGYVTDFRGNKIYYSGKFDVKMKIKDRRALGDWKSSKGVYTSQKYQLGGYDIAEQQAIDYFKRHGQDTTNLEYEAIVVVHIDKNTGIPTLHELTQEEREECQNAFQGLAVTASVEKKLDKWQK